MFNIFINKKFIVRKNFNKQFKKHYPRTFFYNYFVRKILFFIAKKLNLIKKNNPFTRKITHYLYFFQEAKKIEKCEYSSLDIYPIVLEDNARKAIITNTKEEINFKIFNQNSSKFKLGVALLENEIILNPSILEYDILCDIDVLCDGQKENFIFQIPLKNKKHGLVNNFYGNKFFDFYINIEKYINKEIEINLKLKFNKIPFLAFGKNKFDLKNNITNSIAISKPYLNQNNKTKKIIILSIESMTNFFKLEEELNKKFELPNLKKLLDIFNYSNNAFTSCDSTLPNIYGMHTGLLPTQHGTADHKGPLYEEITNKKIKFLGEFLKEKNFINTGFVAGPRFDTLKKWIIGYDNIYSSNHPSSDDAPNFHRLKNLIKNNKDNNLFTYFHYDRLHGPFLHLNNFLTPTNQNIFHLDQAIKSGNFYSIYYQQMKLIDDEIKDFITFLKDLNLYDETMLIITGDHGPSLPPKWVKYSGNALYNEHINVPLYIKKSNWYENVDLKFDEYTTSHFKIFQTILNSLQLNLPEYFTEIPQTKKNFKDMAFSETLHFPKNESYKFCVNSKNLSFIADTEIDWKNYKLKKIINNDEIKDENLKKIINEYINLNLEFRKKYKTNSYLDEQE